MAIPYFQHDYLSKPKLPRPDAAADHLSYLLRKPECLYSYSEKFTITEGASKSKRNMQRFLNRRTKELRANGRVCDKFIIALPVELGLDHWAKACRRFAHRISHGKASYFFAIHEGKRQQENPHAQFIFIDADKVDGQVIGSRVYGTTKLGSTAKLKLEWEAVHNQIMLEAGLDATISFADARQKALERMANQHSIPLDENHPSAPLDPLNVSHETDRTLTFELPEPEDAMDTLVAPREVPAVRALLDHHREALRIAEVLQAVDASAKQLKSARAEAERAVGAANEAEKQAIPVRTAYEGAKQSFEQYMRENGELKGLHINAFGFEWKSPTRKQAERAQHEYAARSFQYDLMLTSLKEHAEHAQRTISASEAAYNKAYAAEAQLRGLEKLYGTTKEIEAAHAMFHRESTAMALNLPEDMLVMARDDGQITTKELQTIYLLRGEQEKARELEEGKDMGLER